MSYTKNVPVPRRSRKAIALAIGISFLGLNAIAALIVRSMRAEPAPPPAPVVSAPAQTPDPAREHRLAGLDAMDRGDYEAAVRSLTDAVRAGDDSPELLRLLGIAQELRRERAIVAPDAQREEIRELVTTVRARPEVVSRPRSTVARVEPRDPRRDESRRDEPVRFELGGTTNEAAMNEEPVVAESPPVVAPSLPSTGSPAPSSPLPPVVDLLPPVVSARTSATFAPSPIPSPPPVAPAPTTRPTGPAPSPRRFGEVEVQSPNVFGDVWVNGRNYGPAPRVVREIPVGSARVEIRVGDTVRRTRTVAVTEGQRARVQLL